MPPSIFFFVCVWCAAMFLPVHVEDLRAPSVRSLCGGITFVFCRFLVRFPTVRTWDTAIVACDLIVLLLQSSHFLEKFLLSRAVLCNLDAQFCAARVRFSRKSLRVGGGWV